MRRSPGIDVAPGDDRCRARKDGAIRASSSWSQTSRRSTPETGYDLVVLLNMPPFFDQMSRSCSAPGGHVVVDRLARAHDALLHARGHAAARLSSATGLETVAAGTAGPGTYYLARRP